MIKRTIEITSGAKLRLQHRQLVIERAELEPATVPIEDIGLLIVDHSATTMTQGLLAELMASGAAVVISGPNHHPAGLMLSLDAHTTQTESHRAQAELSEPVKKRAWQQLISAKLYQQGQVLRACTGADAGLISMSERVKSGDPDNFESQGALRYWQRLFGDDFRRNPDGTAPNNLLNYGYAIIRAAVARAIVGAGLIPTLGVHHRNRSNPFCLADDVMEPYRPYVDLRVRALIDHQGNKREIDKAAKTALLSLLNETIDVGGKRSPMLLAFHATAASLARAVKDGTAEAVDLALPRGLPLPPLVDRANTLSHDPAGH